MKTIKLSAGMPIETEYVTRDKHSSTGHAWRGKPQPSVYDGWQPSKNCRVICQVFIGDALKPGEIARIEK